MNKRNVDADAPLQTIKVAAQLTGYPEQGIRERAKNGSIPGIRRGKVFYVNVPLFKKQLEEESTGIPTELLEAYREMFKGCVDPKEKKLTKEQTDAILYAYEVWKKAGELDCEN